MEYKKISNTALDDFINQSSQAQEESQSDNEKIGIGISVSNTLRDNIRRITKGVYSMTEYYTNALLYDMEYFDNKTLLTLYAKARMQNIAIEDYVKTKLGLIDIPTTSGNYPNRRNMVKAVIYVTKKNKEIIFNIVKNLNVNYTRYQEIKIESVYKLTNLFSPSELRAIKDEADKENLSIKDYIAKKII